VQVSIRLDFGPNLNVWLHFYEPSYYTYGSSLGFCLATDHWALRYFIGSDFGSRVKYLTPMAATGNEFLFLGGAGG
jgi:hypothetical protein